MREGPEVETYQSRDSRRGWQRQMDRGHNCDL